MGGLLTTSAAEDILAQLLPNLHPRDWIRLTALNSEIRSRMCACLDLTYQYDDSLEGEDYEFLDNIITYIARGVTIARFYKTRYEIHRIFTHPEPQILCINDGYYYDIYMYMLVINGLITEILSDSWK